jgi:hypothetical protein
LLPSVWAKLLWQGTTRGDELVFTVRKHTGRVQRRQALRDDILKAIVGDCLTVEGESDAGAPPLSSMPVRDAIEAAAAPR